jgi:hypothetical protein
LWCQQIPSWFLGLKRISEDGCQEVDDGGGRAAMAAMLDGTDVCPRIVPALHPRPFAPQPLIDGRPPVLLPVALELGDEWQAFRPERFQPFWAEVAAIAQQLAP